MAKEIILKNGEIALVSDEDYDYLSHYSWRVNEKGYVSKSHNKKMHKCIIIDIPEGMEIDHINGNKLDNRRENLRVCTHKENLDAYWSKYRISNPEIIKEQVVRAKRKNGTLCVSRYRGIIWDYDRNRWAVVICFKGRKHRFGRYKDDIDAALQYDIKAMEFFGSNSVLNFLIFK